MTHEQKAETIEMIKAIANDSKVRIDKIILNYEELIKENEELKKTNNKLIEEIRTGMIYQELQDEIDELKAQNRKMKCCSNCKHYPCKMDKYYIKPCDKWEI